MKPNFKFFKISFFLLTILLINCKKEETTTDFRDSIVGTYTSTNVYVVVGAKNYFTNLRRFLPDIEIFTQSDTLQQSVTTNVMVTKYPSDASKIIVDYTSSFDNKDTLTIVGSVVTLSAYYLQILANRDSSFVSGNIDSTILNNIIIAKSYTATYSNNQFNLNYVADYIVDVNSTTKRSNPPPLGRTTLVANQTRILKKQ
ncbi:MAG: hypothetical protein ORN85_05385 [Sediminibacterium sp.]|nr:hypothetical protein [Sediminibacterium sp.]